jgi:hypothetical protein
VSWISAELQEEDSGPARLSWQGRCGAEIPGTPTRATRCGSVPHRCCRLVSSRRNGLRILWLSAIGVDTFVLLDDVFDLWETGSGRARVA